MPSQAIPSIWMIFRSDGTPLRTEVNRCMLGPFAYSKRESAEAAASDPKTLLARVEGELLVIEVPGAGFIQSLLALFQEQDSDVLILDEGLYPLTSEGAGWIDVFQAREHWKPIFHQNPETRVNQVLERISAHLGVRQVQVATPSRLHECQQLIQENIHLRLAPEFPHQLNPDGSLGPQATFWIHTAGMACFDRPELEMRHVPAYFVRTAGAALKAWAAYSIDHEIQVGSLLQDGGDTLPVVLRADASPDPYWSDKNGCLTLRLEKVLPPTTGQTAEVLH